MQETKETWVWSLGQEDALEEGVATPSSVLAWRIPCTEESCRLQSMGLHRVWHDWSDLACTHPKASVKAAVMYMVPLSASRYTILVTFQGTVRLKTIFFFYVCLFFMYYLCEKYNPITVQYYITGCVSWIPRLTVRLTNTLDLPTLFRNLFVYTGLTVLS